MTLRQFFWLLVLLLALIGLAYYAHYHTQPILVPSKDTAD